MAIINQNSFIMFAGLILLILFLFLLRKGIGQPELIALAALAIGLSIAFMIFNPGKSSVTEADELDAIFNSERLTLLEFQSPY
jgi:H+/gluconate symporter-like permease